MREKIKKCGMFSAGENVAVGLSGGADSVALLRVLLELRGELGLGGISAVHVNHGLRGAEAARDEDFVRGMCGNLNIPLKVFQADVKNFAAEKGLGIEEAARILRYEFFAEAGGKIATAHNLDDNVETVLMNLCRGTGLRGLGGIPPVNGKIVRPLLAVSRGEIEAYLQEIGAEYVTDSSNLCNDYTRNRVRNVLMPVLVDVFDESSTTAISRASGLFREDENFMEGLGEASFVECFSGGGLDTAKLGALHPAIARRVVRKWCGAEDLTAAHVQAVLDLTRGRAGREVHLPKARVVAEYGWLKFYEKNEKSEGFSYALRLNEPLFIPEISQTVLVSDIPVLFHKNEGCTKVFNCDKMSIVLRTRQAGDKITLGSGEFFTKKLQDYFTDEKIPRRERDSIPLIACGNEILWIMDKKNRTNVKYEGTGLYISIWSDAND
jgi:tRNA(Ile)-lysidine synthase